MSARGWTIFREFLMVMMTFPYPDSRPIPQEQTCLPVISPAGQAADMDRVEMPKKASPSKVCQAKKQFLLLRVV